MLKYIVTDVVHTNRSGVDVGLVRAGNQFDNVLVSVLGGEM